MLTPKRILFVAKYTAIGSETHGNATKSAIAASYSAKTARSQGSRMLKNVDIWKAIAAKTEKQFAEIDYSAERVLEGLANLAFYDIRNFYREDGTLKTIPELDSQTAQVLAGFEVEQLFERFGAGQAKETGTTSKIKMADRGKNLERLGRFHKLFTDRFEVSSSEELVQKLLAGRKRLGK